MKRDVIVQARRLECPLRYIVNFFAAEELLHFWIKSLGAKRKQVPFGADGVTLIFKLAVETFLCKNLQFSISCLSIYIFFSARKYKRRPLIFILWCRINTKQKLVVNTWACESSRFSFSCLIQLFFSAKRYKRRILNDAYFSIMEISWNSHFPKKESRSPEELQKRFRSQDLWPISDIFRSQYKQVGVHSKDKLWV